jgi:histidine ammonia-lyase
VDAKLSRLPAFLAVDGGVDSGFMVAQVAAAALASENKGIAHPASIDSLPTTAGEEDHVSMSTYAARRLSDMADNARGIVAIELLAAAQGIEFRRPHRMGPKLEQALALIRAKVPAYREDRYMKPDIEAVKALIEASAFREYLPAGLLATVG